MRFSKPDPFRQLGHTRRALENLGFRWNWALTHPLGENSFMSHRGGEPPPCRLQLVPPQYYPILRLPPYEHSSEGNFLP